MTRWGELVKRWHALAEITSTNKSSSYYFELHWCYFSGLYVKMGAYEIGGWPRHLELGCFDSEDQAFEAASKKVDEAYNVVYASVACDAANGWRELRGEEPHQDEEYNPDSIAEEMANDLRRVVRGGD